MKRRIVRVFSTLLMAFVIMLFAVSVPVLRDAGAVDVYADATVGSWADLGSAVQSGGTQTITLSGSFAYDGTSIEIPDGADITISGNATIRSINVLATSGKKYESMFVVKSGGKLTIDSGVTLSAKTAEQTCPDGDTYTADTFTGAVSDGGKSYSPKGFFIHVEKNGSATLNGTLSDFVTSRDKASTPRYVAPVVANGAGAVFHIGSTGVIKNNLVGYIVDDEMANNDAQTIKQYVKGAPPNVPRVPNAATQKANGGKYEGRPRGTNAGIDGGVPGSGITATAGAVIYKDGAKGSIQGRIENNRGDTGGIMASGDDTVVTIKTGTTITKNVGVQFGGGSTAEQGGSIAMTGGTMSENVAWFGGGAMYATENGVDWLLGRIDKGDGVSPDFDARKDGQFFMTGGELTKNTAFTRGGAVLADSDGVNIQKGKLTYNMGRMLGGAMYVMGDHPKYEYTVQMTGLYVHDNAAVSGEDETWGASAPTGDILGVWGSGWAALNAPLQTKLQPPSTCADAGAILSGSVDGGRADGNTDDWTDGVGSQGTGGGVWLCAYGNTFFDANSPDKVVIKDNWATGAPNPSGSGYHKSLNGSDLADAKNNSVPSQIPSTENARSGMAAGNDFHADTGNKGKVSIGNLDPAKWYNENTGAKYETEISDGRLNLINLSTAAMPEANVAVEVYGNLSRHGGGLAADGTFLFGMGTDEATPSASMKIEKEWVGSVLKAPVTIRAAVKTAGGDEVLLAEVPLDGVANPPATEFDTVEELEATGNTWNGKFNFPQTVETSNGTEKLYALVYTGPTIHTNPNGGVGFEVTEDMELDPLTQNGKMALGAVLREGRQDDIKVLFGEPVYASTASDPKLVEKTGGKYNYKEISFIFGEWKEDPNTGNLVLCDDYVFLAGEIDLTNIDYKVVATPHYETTYDPGTGQIIDTTNINYHIYLFEIPLVAPMTNDNWPITEKYVNKDVHSDIENFDQEFTYDILAYVPKTATEITITDTLVKGLEFADKDGNPTDDPKKAIQSITMKMSNNHLPGEEGTAASGTVLHTNNGNPIDFIAWGPKYGEQYYPIMSIDDRTISVTFNHTTPGDDRVFGINNADQKWLPGRWIQLTFNARIKDEYRSLDALQALRAEVSGKNKSWEGTSTDKQGSDPRDVTFANGDLGLVEALVKEVGPDPIVWGVEGPSRLFARSSRGEYYATTMDDNKQGLTWVHLEKGSSDWQNADNRYNGRSPEADNSGAQIKQGDARLNALKNQPLVMGHTLIKGAEGGSRLFVMTEDAKNPKGTHIFATPENDKSGAIWTELTDPNRQVYKNAVARLTPDSGTIRMLDLTNTGTSLDADSKNWPVISEEEHEGMANQGTYKLKFGNGAKGTYKTNTVTVNPEPVDLTVMKEWVNANTSEIPSPEDFKTFLVLNEVKKNGEGEEVKTDVTKTHLDKLKVLQNGDGSYTAKWTGLPKLKSTEYSYEFDEKDMPGFTTEIDRDTNTITNTKKREEKPEIEKYVNQAVHKDIELDEVFTYDIIAYITKDADSVTITDTLNDVLVFESAVDDIKVVDLGEEDNHLVTNNTAAAKVNENATVAQEGTVIDAAEVTIDGQNLKVFITNKMKPITEYYNPVDIQFVNPMLSGLYEEDNGNYVESQDEVADSSKTYYEKGESSFIPIATTPGDDVTGLFVKNDFDEYVPTEDTEAVDGTEYYEEQQNYNEVLMEYTNPKDKGYYEKNAEEYILSEDTVADANKTYFVKETVDDDSMGYEYDGDEQPVTALRGRWIKVTFSAKIKDGLTVEDVKKAFATINSNQVEERAEENKGNAPVVSAEDHTGIPNDASYTIGVANEAGIEEDVYGDRSNTVTVKPLVEEPEEEEKKQDEEVAPKGKETQKTEQKSAAAPSNGKVSAANTGDETRPALWVVMMILAAAVAGVCIYRRRKGNA